MDPGGEEFLIGLAENEGIKESILQWGRVDLSLIKGVKATRNKRVKSGTPASRRVLEHMKYDKRSG